jgi:uncharacterized phage protein (TIGR01671 family)
MLQPKIYVKDKKKVYDIQFIDYKNKRVTFFDSETQWTYTRSFDEVEFMENTGLKDVNGKYVYTGDIVEVENWGCGAVIYKKNAYTYMTKAIDEDWCLSIYGCLSDTKSVKVIGNIYKNKELLKR